MQQQGWTDLIRSAHICSVSTHGFPASPLHRDLDRGRGAFFTDEDVKGGQLTHYCPVYCHACVILAPQSMLQSMRYKHLQTMQGGRLIHPSALKLVTLSCLLTVIHWVSYAHDRRRIKMGMLTWAVFQTAPMFPMPIFPVPIFPVPMFPVPIFPVPIFLMPIFPVPIFPVPIFPVPIFPVPMFPVPMFPVPMLPEPIFPVPMFPCLWSKQHVPENCPDMPYQTAVADISISCFDKMTSEKTPVSDGQQNQENVFVRLLNIPVVSCTSEMIERSYRSTKEAHPLVASLCDVYESGVRTAGSLALRGMRPAIDRLKPQIVAANSLACQGLDHLEEKIPALQHSPEKLATGISEAVSSTYQTARDGITSPVLAASDAVVSLASGGFSLTRSTLSNGACYVLDSRPIHLAKMGAGRALSEAERLVNYILPPSPDETGVEKEGDVSKEQQSGDDSSLGPKPSLSRLRVLVNTACRRAYSQTATQLQRTKSRGQDLVAHIPGVGTLAGYAKQNLEAVGTTILSINGAVAVLFEDPPHRRGETQDRNGEPLKSGSRLQELVSSVGQQLQSAYVSVVSGVKGAPNATMGMTRDGANMLVESLSSAKERTLANISYYGLKFSSGANKQATPTGVQKEEGGKATSSDASQPDKNGAGPPDIQNSSTAMDSQVSEEARQLQKRVLQEIPIQQRAILSGSCRSLPPPGSRPAHDSIDQPR
ncbi:hypothetical protein ACEWY4_010296 [Coilia grayii]|uniref:Uncharacterized protein n=1 Tax=Coilia grayii TaxID=363190 RepID=A0ABD1K1I4_9TELE